MQWSEKKAKGRVKMRVFAQRCNQCPEPPFATPEFTWDNISRILNNLLFRILKKCYKEGFKQMNEIPLLGDTSLEGPHDSGNCEACLLGFCAQNDLGQASKPPAPPLSPTSLKSTREPKVTAPCSNIPCSRSSSKVEERQAPPAPPLSPTSLKSTQEPKVTAPCSNISYSRSSSKVEEHQASKANPQASNPTKDPKVSCTSKPSTIPRLKSQQQPVVSSPAPRCVIQMPSPVNSSRAADMAKNTRSKTPKAWHASSLYVPPTSSNVPFISSSYDVPISSSWRPSENTTCQAERSSHIHPQSQSSCCKGGCSGCCGACCEGCCEGGGGFGGCCMACCNCMSQKPLCCLFFLILLLLLWYLL